MAEVQDVVRQSPRYQLNLACGCTSFSFLVVPSLATLVMSLKSAEWSVPFARYDYQDYSPPASIEPNGCLLSCASSCDIPPLRTMATNCVKVEVDCQCGGGRNGGCTGCRTVCSSEPGWLPYAETTLAVPACAEAIANCTSTCSCSKDFHNRADIAFSWHVWVSLFVLAPFAFCLLCIAAWCLKIFMRKLFCCRRNAASEASSVSPTPVGYAAEKSAGALETNGRREPFLIPIFGLTWLALAVMLNAVDVFLGWHMLSLNIGSPQGLSEVCGHEYVESMGLKRANIAASVRAGALVFAISCTLLSSLNGGASKQVPEKEEHVENVVVVP